MYMDMVALKEQVYEDLKGDSCYDELANHVEEGVETQAQSQAETELESQSQSQGLGHSARRVQLLPDGNIMYLILPFQLLETSKLD